MDNNECKLSNVTKIYLKQFHKILDNMIIGMVNAPLQNSISHNFIMQMIPHHKGAVEMSSNILKYTTNIELQNIALNIVSTQTKSIKSMLDIQEICSNLKNTEGDLVVYQRGFHVITKIMFSNMRYAPVSNNINEDFIHEMIPHHEGAIRMCKNALMFDICPELVPIMNKIIISQYRGIFQLKELLEKI